MTFVMFLLGISIVAWAAMRLNRTKGSGEWALKLIVLNIIPAALTWTWDVASGEHWSVDGVYLMASLVLYLWWGAWRHSARFRYRREPQ